MAETVTFERIAELTQAQIQMLQRLAAEHKALEEAFRRLATERDHLRAELDEARLAHQEYSQAVRAVNGSDFDEEKVLAEILECKQNPAGPEELKRIIDELENGRYD